jgi:hypothetical protein
MGWLVCCLVVYLFIYLFIYLLGQLLTLLAKGTATFFSEKFPTNILHAFFISPRHSGTLQLIPPIVELEVGGIRFIRNICTAYVVS